MKAISARSVAAQAACFVLFMCAQSIRAETYGGTVTGVIDGDTIEVLHNNVPERIRLAKIDCPEKSQPYGSRAKEATSSLVFGKHVQVESQGKDRYGRTIADIRTDDGTDVNKKLVELGYAWQYLRYSHSQDLSDQENNARSNHLGLWADTSPVPPWQYRQARRALAHARSGSGLHSSYRSSYGLSRRSMYGSNRGSGFGSNSRSVFGSNRGSGFGSSSRSTSGTRTWP